MSETHGFNTNKIFIILFILTGLEVGWSFIPFPTWAHWGGLLLFAYMKGHLIFSFFMHMKFEGWIVKGLMVPTIPLMMIVVFANMPDTSKNDLLVYPLTTQLETAPDQVEDGKLVRSERIVELNETQRAVRSAELKSAHGGGGGH